MRAALRTLLRHPRLLVIHSLNLHEQPGRLYSPCFLLQLLKGVQAMGQQQCTQHQSLLQGLVQAHTGTMQPRMQKQAVTGQLLALSPRPPIEASQSSMQAI